MELVGRVGNVPTTVRCGRDKGGRTITKGYGAGWRRRGGDRSPNIPTRHVTSHDGRRSVDVTTGPEGRPRRGPAQGHRPAHPGVTPGGTRRGRQGVTTPTPEQPSRTERHGQGTPCDRSHCGSSRPRLPLEGVSRFPGHTGCHTGPRTRS